MMNQEVLDAHAKEPLCIWWLSGADVASFAPPYPTYDNTFAMRPAIALTRLPGYVYAFFLRCIKGDLPFGGYTVGKVWYPRNLSVDVTFDYNQEAMMKQQNGEVLFGNALGLILPLFLILPLVAGRELPGILTTLEGEWIEPE